MSSMTQLSLAPSSEGDERQLMSASDAPVGIGNSRRSRSQGDGTNEALLRRQMRPDRYTHSRLRFFRANPRCLSDGTGPRGKAVTDLFQVPQTLPTPFFYLQVVRQKSRNYFKVIYL